VDGEKAIATKAERSLALDEMVVRIAGERLYLWRAVDDEARFSTCWSNADVTVGRRCG
jgi:transposase-like protein